MFLEVHAVTCLTFLVRRRPPTVVTGGLLPYGTAWSWTRRNSECIFWGGTFAEGCEVRLQRTLNSFSPTPVRAATRLSIGAINRSHSPGAFVRLHHVNYAGGFTAARVEAVARPDLRPRKGGNE
jgi:hypothetical protein